MTSTAVAPETHKTDVASKSNGYAYRAPVDIVELSDEFVLTADLPGARGNEIDVQFEDGQLSVRASVKPRQSDQVNYLLREYGVGDFYRTFRLSEHVDANRIVAEYADGVLTLRLPKSAALKPRKISVKS